MADNERIAAQVGSSAGRGSAAGSLASMPEDLLAESCQRVRIASLAVGALWAFAVLMNDVVVRLMPAGQDFWRDSWEQIGRPASAAGLLLSLLMAWVAGRWRDRPREVLRLGLVFEVATALLIAVHNWWEPVMHGARVSWVCVLVLVYPSIAPNTVRATLAASLAAALADVLGFAIAAARGALGPDATPFVVLWSLAGPFICAFLAVIPVKVIRRLGRQVSQARLLGSYRLEERIGRGGMGEVYRASHRMLARPAAIKLVRPELLGADRPAGGREILERFRREADAAACLRSPHTIELYDFGVAADGTFFYVMELLDGVDLETLVDRWGPQPAERVVHILRQACESLAEAHARGLVHRDVKPSNIFVCRLGLRVDFVKVLDFGLVKRERAQGAAATQLTSPGSTTGTPAFMAPEAALESDQVDRRSDVYALGCVAYWLLAGKLVFEADTPMKMLLQHVQAEPVPPSRRAGIALPAELEALVLRCLAKQPEDRPPDAAALARELDAVPLASVWDESRAQEWWRANRGAAASADEKRPANATATLLHARVSDSAP